MRVGTLERAKMIRCYRQRTFRNTSKQSLLALVHVRTNNTGHCSFSFPTNVDSGFIHQPSNQRSTSILARLDHFVFSNPSLGVPNRLKRLDSFVDMTK